MRACAVLNVTLSAGFATVLLFSACGGARNGSGAAASAATEPTMPASGAEGAEAPHEGPAAPSQGGAERSTEAIASEVRLHRDDARACYDGLQEQNKLPAGDLVVHFVLNPDGSVKETSRNEERSTLKDPELLECVASVIRGIQFPASTRGMETAVNYPFNFNPRGR